jgi:hypothetical protein
MKHIKKKYLFQIESKDEVVNNWEVVSNSTKQPIKVPKDKALFITTDNDIAIRAFSLSTKNGNAIMPIPDLTLVYFDSAYTLNRERKILESKLLEKIIPNNNRYGEDATNEIYHFYGNASGIIIFLFTSLESFINHILPDDKSYVLSTDKNTTIFNKIQIQRNLSFDKKLKEVLPQLLEGKNFFKNQTTTNQHLTNLKQLRDELIHTKSDLTFSNQESLIKRLLNFKYDDTFQAVTKFMNFYIPEYIEECKCGKDF